MTSMCGHPPPPPSEAGLGRHGRHQAMVLRGAAHPDAVCSADTVWLRLCGRRPAVDAHPGVSRTEQGSQSQSRGRSGQSQACQREESRSPHTAAPPRRVPGLGPERPSLRRTEALRLRSRADQRDADITPARSSADPGARRRPAAAACGCSG